jgi:hypothetical protein
MCVEQSVECLAGETDVLGEKPALVPLSLPQIPHDLTWARTRAATLEIRRLTPWATTRLSLRRFVCDAEFTNYDSTGRQRLHHIWRARSEGSARPPNGSFPDALALAVPETRLRWRFRSLQTGWALILWWDSSGEKNLMAITVVKKCLEGNETGPKSCPEVVHIRSWRVTMSYNVVVCGLTSESRLI